MPIGIYPPTLLSSLPAFLYTETSYPIYFTLLKITEFNEIGHILIRIVKLSNNRSIVNTAKYPDGTIYKTPALIFLQGNKYFVSVLNTDLAETWLPGYLYKVQMRFGTTPMFDDISLFAAWKKQLIDNLTFSEWSTVMILKAIHKPDTYIENAESVTSTEITATERTEPTLTPLFFGVCNTNAVDKEIVDKYKFDLYLGSKDIKSFENNYNEDLIESSGWLLHNASVGSLDLFRFKNILTNDKLYTVIYSIQTVNGYNDIAEPYTFLASKAYLGELENVQFRVEDDTIYCRENGCINLYLTTLNGQKLSGSYVITRSSEKTNYEVWEDLKFITIPFKEFNDILIYLDFTIESGVKYKYAFLQENSAGLRTNPLYNENNSECLVNFEYSYFYHDRILLRLMFNLTLSSFKHTTLSSKQDTLGDKYPHLTRNGYAYYAEFPLSGLISFLMDSDYTFLDLRNDGFYYEDDLAIPRYKFEELGVDRIPCQEAKTTSGATGTNYNNLTINRNLIDDNIFIERKFREKVEEFLNNFDYKLYKSPTEGNIVVVLLNVSLTPNNTVGRMIYNFSATAYEVMENTLENLDEFGVIDIGEFESLASDDTIISFGLLSGLYTISGRSGGLDVYSLIKQQEEVSYGNGYKLLLKLIKSFLIERYPNYESILNKDYVDLEVTAEYVRNRPIGSAELVKLNAMLAKAKNENADEAEIAELEKLIDVQTTLQEVVQSSPEDSTIILSVNGKNIIVALGKIYSLTYPISSLEIIAANYPIIINYVCEMNLVEDLSVGIVTAVDASRIWGLIAGVFTDNENIVKKGYNFESGNVDEEPYRVYSKSTVGLVYDKNGNIVVDNTNYNIYKTLNLYEIIKEETRRLVEVIYGVTDGFHLNDNGIWESGNVQYIFAGLTAFDIETDPNTTIKIGKMADGSDAITIKVGETGRYTLSPIESELIHYIKLEESCFAIVNYKCLTTLRRIKIQGG